MVKHLEFQDCIDFATPETVFKLLYEDDAFTKFYHKKVNSDSNASATTWIKNDAGTIHREVTFKPHISNVPPFLQRFIGNDIAPLTEVQQYTRDDNAITIHSELSATIFRSFTLVSTGDTILSSTTKGCAISVKLTLQLQTMAWYFPEWFERVAETESKAAFGRWLNLAREFCDEKMGKAVEPLLEGEDIYFDAGGLEEEETVSSLRLDSKFVNVLPTKSNSRHSGILWFLQMDWKQQCHQYSRIQTLSMLLQVAQNFRHVVFTSNMEELCHHLESCKFEEG